jgi:hypothetical protein
MTKPDEPLPFSHDRDELIRDVTLLGRLKDIRDSVQMEDVLAPKWWEAAVGVVQFAPRWAAGRARPLCETARGSSRRPPAADHDLLRRTAGIVADLCL